MLLVCVLSVKATTIEPFFNLSIFIPLLLLHLFLLQRTLEEKKSLKVEAKNSERAAMQSFHDKTAVLEIYTKVYAVNIDHSMIKFQY